MRLISSNIIIALLAVKIGGTSANWKCTTERVLVFDGDSKCQGTFTDDIKEPKLIDLKDSLN